MFDSFEALDDMTRGAVIDLLYRLADDELIMGHREAEWTAIDSIPPGADAFSSMARDEVNHARAYYQMLSELGEGDPDTLVSARKTREFRCASLVTMPQGDEALSVLRRFLYDAAETVRLAALSRGSLVPLAQLAARLRREETNHLVHGRGWVIRLGNTNEEGRRKMQYALALTYPCALGLFEPTEADEVLAQTAICPQEDQLRREWESAVSPVLAEAGLEVDPALRPVYGGRVGRHPQSFAGLLENLRSRR